MEGVSAKVYSGLKGYWKTKGYERLDGSGRRRNKRVQVAKMGGADGGSGNLRFWRFKMRRKLRLWKMGPAKKFFAKLRDGYVKMMMGIANSRVVNTGYGGVVGEMNGFGRPQLKEYDQKMIVEIYKSILMAQGQMTVPGGDAGILVAGSLPPVKE